MSLPKVDHLNEPPWYLTRSWTKAELAAGYGFTTQTLMKKFRESGVQTGGRNKHLSPLQVLEFIELYGPPYHPHSRPLKLK